MTSERDALIANAVSLMEQGHPDRAEGPLRHLLRSRDDPEALALLADCLLQQGRNEDALKQLDLGMASEHDEARLQGLLADACLRMDQLARAEIAAERAASLDPSSADLQALLSAVYLARGSRLPALNTAERGLALLPRHPGCTRMRIRALLALLRRGEALEAAHAAVILEPRDPELRTLLARAEIECGRWRQGRRRLLEVIRANPGHPAAQAVLRDAERVHHPLIRLHASLALEAEDWGGPVRILSVTTMILMRPWELSFAHPRGLLILLPPAASLIVSYLVSLPMRRRHPEALQRLRAPGALRRGEIALGRLFYAGLIAATLAVTLLAWLRLG